jgi:FkbM family methyltransferase
MKNLVKKILRRFGWELRRVPPRGTLGIDPVQDMQTVGDLSSDSLIFDVGANVGQSVLEFKQHFPEAYVHSFEPSDAACAKLQENIRGLDRIQVNPFGLGSTTETRPFFENTHSTLSSFLKPGADCWGTVQPRPLFITTLDRYCDERNVEHIDLLKLDTQGYDLEVLKGGAKLLEAQRVHLVLVEITFCDLYENGPSIDSLYRFLKQHHFDLVALYKMYYLKNRAGWTDALFINPNARRETLKRSATGSQAK